MFTLIPSPTCPRCQRPVLEDAEQVVCDACLATHHERCWHQGAGCSATDASSEPAPPPARPAEIRLRPKVKSSTSSPARSSPEATRRRHLVHSLAHREEHPEADLESVPARPSFQAPRRGLPAPGEERPCRKCRTPFVVSDPLEQRCKRCVQATYWKIGLVFAGIVAWKVLFS